MLESPQSPKLEWKAPPQNEPTEGGGRGQSSFAGITNTQLGDAVEKALIEQRGMRNLHPRRRQGPLDLAFGRYGFEVKAVTTASKEYKARPKKHEVTSKLREARRYGLKPGIVIVVVERDGTGHVYWRDRLGAFQVNELMHYAGTIKVDLDA